MTAEAPLTPDTLRFIREMSPRATALEIADELNWEIARLRKTVRERLPGVELTGGDEPPVKKPKAVVTFDETRKVYDVHSRLMAIIEVLRYVPSGHYFTAEMIAAESSVPIKPNYIRVLICRYAPQLVALGARIEGCKGMGYRIVPK